MAFVQRICIEQLLDCLGPGDTAGNEIKQCLCLCRTDMLVDKKKTTKKYITYQGVIKLRRGIKQDEGRRPGEGVKGGIKQSD